jgi:phage baseplate assembly protein W
MQPDFGSMLPYLIFEPYTHTLKEDLAFYTKEALIKWEPRILIKSVMIDDSGIDNNSISIVLEYSIKGINSLNRFTIPISLQSDMKFTPAGNFNVSGKGVF